MERRHFELERGYLNIDADGLYLTRSGNWQEALSAPERTVRRKASRGLYLLFGAVLIGIRALFELSHLGPATANKVMFGLGLAGAGLLFTLQRFRHDLAPTYRIPFSKVRSLEGGEGRITVHLINGDHREEQVVIEAPPAAVDLARSAFAASRS
ncbi:MAG: hypothetical protein JNL05_11185 [Flavobacteriales bacterium]|nr:hypothetical protein [Flavobacteriales bacterium]